MFLFNIDNHCQQGQIQQGPFPGDSRLPTEHAQGTGEGPICSFYDDWFDSRCCRGFDKAILTEDHGSYQELSSVEGNS